MTRSAPRLAAYRERGRWLCRPRIAPGQDGRLSPLELNVPDDPAAAQARADLLAELLAALTLAGHGRDLLERAARNLASASGAELADHVAMLRKAAAGVFASPQGGPAITVRAFGERWTSGELARQYPHIGHRRTAAALARKLARWIYPVIGDLPLAAVRVEHLEEIARLLAAKLLPSTQNWMLASVRRLLNLAVYPARLLDQSPFPASGMLVRETRRTLPFLRPEEDQKLMACLAVPLPYRLFYGFLHRLGLRRSELRKLTWARIDLEQGLVRFTDHKTVDHMGEKLVPLEPPLVRALRWWKGRAPDQAVFAGVAFDRLLEHVRLAGIEREELFSTTATRRRLSLHHSRGAFATIAYAQGKPTVYITERTGHLSEATLARYLRAGRLAERMGDWSPLDEAVPEMVADRARGSICPQGAEYLGGLQSARFRTRFAHLDAPSKTGQKVLVSLAAPPANDVCGQPADRPIDALPWTVITCAGRAAA